MRRLSICLATALAAAAPLAAQAPIAEVQVAPPWLRLRLDARVQLLATVYDTAGLPVDVPVRWLSSNINVVDVGEGGMVHARGPGVAIVRAVAERGGRTRSGQTTIFVQREPRAAVHPVAPTEPAPGAHPAPAPSPTPALPGEPGVVRVNPRQVDSLMRASINCEEPFISSANPLRACYDRRPTPRERPVIGPMAECAQMRPVRLMVRVGEDGAVTDVRVVVPSLCDVMDDSALARARRIPFNPALREGRPVAAWIQLHLGPDPKSLLRQP